MKHRTSCLTQRRRHDRHLRRPVLVVVEQGDGLPRADMASVGFESQGAHSIDL